MCQWFVGSHLFSIRLLIRAMTFLHWKVRMIWIDIFVFSFKKHFELTSHYTQLSNFVNENMKSIKMRFVLNAKRISGSKLEHQWRAIDFFRRQEQLLSLWLHSGMLCTWQPVYYVQRSLRADYTADSMWNTKIGIRNVNLP